LLLSQANEVEDAIAADNQRAVPVSITGASGSRAAHINGLFEPTQATGPDGRVVYAKCGDASVCIRHMKMYWQVKHAKGNGKWSRLARVEGGCALEACTSRVWDVRDGDAVNLTMQSMVNDTHTAAPTDHMPTTFSALTTFRETQEKAFPSKFYWNESNLKELFPLNSLERRWNGNLTFSSPSHVKKDGTPNMRDPLNYERAKAPSIGKMVELKPVLNGVATVVPLTWDGAQWTREIDHRKQLVSQSEIKEWLIAQKHSPTRPPSEQTATLSQPTEAAALQGGISKPLTSPSLPPPPAPRPSHPSPFSYAFLQLSVTTLRSSFSRGRLLQVSRSVRGRCRKNESRDIESSGANCRKN
jgi:hypothetical protein